MSSKNGSVSPSTLVGFASLMWGRHDAFYHERDKAVRKPVTLDLFRRHLIGIDGIGTYPVRDDTTCRWSCIDIDYDDLDAALNVRDVWQFMGIQAWVETSRSKGYHVWVFHEWLGAYWSRRAGRYVATVAGLPEKTEINPKNDAPWLTSNGLVNTVRAPYYGNANDGRMVVLDDEGTDEIPLARFVGRGLQGRNRADAIRGVARTQLAHERMALLAIQAEAQERHPGAYAKGHAQSSSNQEALAILRGQRAIRRGERDNQIYTVAMFLHGFGLEYEEAIERMTEVYEIALVDKAGYPLRQALAKVNRAYGR
jgi:hypothetical protein